MRLGPAGGEIEAASENGEASISSSGVVAAELANGDETFGFVCEVVEEDSGETGNLPLVLDLPPPTVKRVGLP